jgi:hypothetical protein
MELVANVPDNLLRRTATNFAFFDFAGAPVNDFLPLRFGVSVHSVVEAGDKLPGKVRPVLFWQGQHFGHFLSSNAQAAAISAFTGVLASLQRLPFTERNTSTKIWFASTKPPNVECRFC